MPCAQPRSDPCRDAPRQSHRRFQFSLRSLFIATALIAAALGAISLFFRDVLEERTALASLRRLGYTVKHSLPLLDGQHPLLNIDFLIVSGDRCFDGDGIALVLRFRRLKTLYLGCDRIEPGTLRRLGELRSLQFLFVGGPHVDDDGLRGIGTAVALVQLSISGPEIRGGGLAEVASMKKLRSILLRGNPHLRDFSAVNLRNLPDLDGVVLDGSGMAGDCLDWLPENCMQLSLQSTSAGDGTLRGLSRCTRLEELDLSYTRVTGEGLRHLASLPRLRSLGLAGCPISDASLDYIASLRGLQSLDLCRTPISDAGLDRLCKVSQPMDITVSACPRITAAGVARLRESLAHASGKGPNGPYGAVDWRNP
jgi:hypothetical protein